MAPSPASAPSWCIAYGGCDQPTSNNVVENSEFWDLGSHGIRIGDDASTTDTKDNVAKYNTVQNNVIEGYGRVYPDSEGIVQGQGDHNLYVGNEIYHGYKAAVRVRYVGNGLPNGVYPSHNTISYNLVHDCFKAS